MTVSEIAARGWYKSSYSAQANECVEIRQVAPGGVAVRDSKDQAGPVLAFPVDAWGSFLAGLKGGDFPTG
ncbi:DUF397 domain-containing protein [Kitasatospora sp. NPDC051170]|uniref:DUF397 domain-containing protein n=1 Tax=Kitasatospora sp. NPDC051170 TaxID=3364056 RepID=UPI00378C6713